MITLYSLLIIFIRESTNTVHVQWLRGVSSQLGTLSTLCAEMMNKCQHRRIQQVRVCMCKHEIHVFICK